MSGNDNHGGACGIAGEDCPVESAIRVIGGKWKLLIIRVLLLEGPKRFNRLLEGLDGISSKVLSQALAGLAASGIVERREISQVPRHAEYALTPLGEELMPIFKALGNWRSGRPGAAPEQARHATTNLPSR